MKKGIQSSIQRVGFIGLIGYLCGCHAPQPATPEAQLVLPAKTRVKLVALADMKVPGNHADRNVGAYFLLVDADELSFFENYFKDNIPRVVVSAGKDQTFKDLARNDAGGVIDKVTQKPGVLLGFQKIEIKGDQAHVELVESGSLSAITIHAFEMKLQNGQWTILIHSQRALS